MYTSKEVAKLHRIPLAYLKTLRERGFLSKYKIEYINGSKTFYYDRNQVESTDLNSIMKDIKKEASVHENMKKFYEQNGFVTSKIVKEYLNINDPRLRKLDDAKLLTPVRIGKFFLYDFDEVKDLLANRKDKFDDTVKTKYNYTNRTGNCLFDFIDDYKAIEFCRLTKKGYTPEYIRIALGISKKMKPLCVEKHEYLRRK